MRFGVLVFLLSTALRPTSASAQGPRLDASFASTALDFLERGDTTLLTRIAASPAGHHIGTHARRIAVAGGPTDRGLVGRILDSVRTAGRLNVPAVRTLLHTIMNDRQSLARCWSEAATYLPPGALDRTVLYLQVGYDIGVAVGGEASLNIAHPHFADAREVWFYCVHEVHHAGVQHYHDLPYLSQVRTTRDLAALIRYLTFLEGMAVHAARGWRAESQALNGDADYVALGDSARMTDYESAFFRIYSPVADAPSRPLKEADWKILDRFSSGDRLWYRVGALMADRIERSGGKQALRKIVIQGPDRFFSAYASLARRDFPQATAQPGPAGLRTSSHGPHR